MKRLSTFLFCGLVPWLVFGQGFTFRDPTFNCVAPVSGGTPVKKDEQATDNDYYLLGDDTTEKYGGSSWLAGSSYSLTSIKRKLAKTGDTAGTIKFHIYAASGCPTGAPLGTSVETVNLTALPDPNGGYVEFTFSPPITITSGQQYSMVSELSQPATGRFYNRVNSSFTGQTICKSSDGSSFSTMFGNQQAVFETWGY